MEEMDVPNGSGLGPNEKYQVIQTEAKVERLVPLRFGHGIERQRAESQRDHRGSRGGRPRRY